MADKYTIADVPVAPDPAPAPSFKERMITLEKDVKQTESFTVAQLEGQMASCDSQIENLKKQKADLKAKADAATAALDK